MTMRTRSTFRRKAEATRTLLVLASAAFLIAVVSRGEAPLQAQNAPAQSRVTFTETIAPIVYENCVTCHRPGEAAPFSLISYDDVKNRGQLIAAVTGVLGGILLGGFRTVGRVLDPEGPIPLHPSARDVRAAFCDHPGERLGHASPNP